MLYTALAAVLVGFWRLNGASRDGNTATGSHNCTRLNGQLHETQESHRPRDLGRLIAAAVLGRFFLAGAGAFGASSRADKVLRWR